MKKIVVTGGSGTAGVAVIKELQAHGYDVLNIDRQPPQERISRFVTIDMMEQGQVFEALHDADAVVHMAAVPAPNIISDEMTFRNNTTSTFNVFNAAIKLKLQRVVWASSMRAVGVPYPDGVRPAYFPVDEDHPFLPDSSYSLSKVISEEMARQFSRWSGIPFVGLRFSYIARPDSYPHFLAHQQESTVLRRELWGYVDARDAALACRLGLEAPIQGAEVFLITAADSAMHRPMPDLLKQYYPEIPVKRPIQDYESLFSIEKARELLGYHPQHSWRDHV